MGRPKGTVINEKQRRKISTSLKTYYKTHNIWNKDKKCPQISNGKRGQPRIGKKHTKKTRQQISQNKKGCIPWNKGKKNIYSKEAREKMGDSHRGIKLSKELIKKCLRRRIKSTLELKFENIINKFNLPYKFVGNGKVLIGGKCPDFVNTNGKKIAIEVYYRKHKEIFKNITLEEWRENRIKIFADYGWELLFFNEIEVNEENILNILGGDLH